MAKTEVTTSYQRMRDELQDWLRFVVAESHVLSAYPDLVWQQGANQPRRSAVSRNASTRQHTQHSGGRPWLKWINKHEQHSALLMTLSGHSGPVMSAAISPDARLVASASKDDTLRVWDAVSGVQLYMLGSENPSWDLEKAHGGSLLEYWPLAFSGINRQLVSARTAGSIDLYNESTGEMSGSLASHQQVVLDISVTPDMSLIVSGAADGVVSCWDAKSGALLHSHKVYQGAVDSIATTADGHRIFTRGDETINCWSARAGEEMLRYTVEGSGDQELASGDNLIAVTPDGNRLFLGGGIRQPIKVLEAASGTELARLEADEYLVRSMAVSSDGRFLVSGGSDKTVKIWELGRYRQVSTLLGHTKDVTAVAISQDGKTIVSGSDDFTLRVWEVPTRNLPWEATHEARAVAIASNGRTIVSTGKGIRVWNPRDGGVLQEMREASRVIGLALTPTGRHAAVATPEHNVEVWDLDRASKLHTLSGHQAAVRTMALTLDAKLLVTGDDDNVIKVWDMESGRLRHTLRWFTEAQLRRRRNAKPKSLLEMLSSLLKGSGGVTTLAITPDCRRVIAGTIDGAGAFKIWDLKTGGKIRTLHKHDEMVRAIAVSPDGRLFLTGADDGNLVLWSIRRRRKLLKIGGSIAPDAGLSKRFFRHEPLTIRAIAAMPDCRRFVWGGWDGLVYLWDPDQKTTVVSFAAHTSSVRAHRGAESGVQALAVTPDGRYIVSAGDDGNLVVIDIAHRRRLALFPNAAPIKRIATQDNLIAATDEIGNVLILELCGIEPAPRIVTARRHWWMYYYDCGCCGLKIRIEFADIGKSAVCSGCGQHYKLNSCAVFNNVPSKLHLLFG